MNGTQWSFAWHYDELTAFFQYDIRSALNQIVTHAMGNSGCSTSGAWANHHLFWCS